MEKNRLTRTQFYLFQLFIENWNDAFDAREKTQRSFEKAVWTFNKISISKEWYFFKYFNILKIGNLKEYKNSKKIIQISLLSIILDYQLIIY